MLRLATVLVGSLMFLSSSAQAIEVAVTIGTNVGDSGFQDATFSDFERNSALSLTDSGGSAANSVGAVVTAGTRYAEYAWADNFSGTTNPTFTADYRVTLEITGVSPGTVFDLQMNTTRLGALTLVEDCCLSSTVFAEAHIGAVTVQVNSSPEAGLGMSGLDLDTPSSTDPQNLEINQASSVTLNGLNSNLTFVLDFTWTTEVFSNNDEGAVRLGLDSVTLASLGVSADDYPGVGSRTIGLDGHFVSFSATVTGAPVPEPTSVLLMAAGLAIVGAAVGGRRNKRTSGS